MSSFTTRSSDTRGASPRRGPCSRSRSSALLSAAVGSIALSLVVLLFGARADATRPNAAPRPDLGITVPSIPQPTIPLPTIPLPTVTVPVVTLPSTLPLTLPEVTIPDLTVPDISLPPIAPGDTLPDLDTPSSTASGPTSTAPGTLGGELPGDTEGQGDAERPTTQESEAPGARAAEPEHDIDPVAGGPGRVGGIGDPPGPPRSAAPVAGGGSTTAVPKAVRTTLSVVPGSITAQVRAYSFPLALAAAIGLYLVVQGRLDGGDPKLTDAPLDSLSSRVPFR